MTTVPFKNTNGIYIVAGTTLYPATPGMYDFLYPDIHQKIQLNYNVEASLLYYKGSSKFSAVQVPEPIAKEIGHTILFMKNQ